MTGGPDAEALLHFRKALEFEPNSAVLHFNYRRALAAAGRLRAGLAHVGKAVQLSGGAQPAILERPAAFCAEAGRRQEAAAAASRGLEAARRQGGHAPAERRNERIRRLAS